jgi:hypothetical protein
VRHNSKEARNMHTHPMTPAAEHTAGNGDASQLKHLACWMQLNKGCNNGAGEVPVPQPTAAAAHTLQTCGHALPAASCFRCWPCKCARQYPTTTHVRLSFKVIRVAPLYVGATGNACRISNVLLEPYTTQPQPPTQHTHPHRANPAPTPKLLSCTACPQPHTDVTVCQSATLQGSSIAAAAVSWTGVTCPT